MKKKILLFVLFMLLLMPCYKVKAKTLQDLKNELANLQAQKKEADNNKNLTDSQITTLNGEISSIALSIEETKNSIKNTEDEITESNNQIEEKSKETDELLKFLQVSSGENVYLEYIFEAESYTDFIYRYSVVSQLADYNNNLMEELKVLVENLEKKKVELDNNKENLVSKSNELNSKLAVLKTNLASYKELGTTIEEDIKELKESIAAYEERGCKNGDSIPSCGNSNVMVNAKGWSYPLAWGCVTSEYVGFGYREDWSGGSGHHGIDLDCVGEGTKVYAAAAGIVDRVVYYSSCGGNMVWIYHKVNNVEYTTVYMHLLSISVSKGQAVTNQTVVGTVGGGSTSSYDGCTGGAHLHFGIAYGYHSSGFNSYSFNPRNVYSFPKLIYSGGGYFSR